MPIITPPASWKSSVVLCEKRNNAWVLKPRITPYYIIIPIFEATIEENFFNKEITNGYSFISSEEFHKKYTNILYDVNNLLENDIKIPVVGDLITRPIARFLLIKEIQLDDRNDAQSKINNDITLKREFDYINIIIEALHLLQYGAIYINNVYVLSNNTSENYIINSSTSLYEIKNHYFIDANHSYFIPQYNITPDIVSNLEKVITQLQTVGNKYTIPLFYFNKYFSSYDLIAKLINLSIVWESSILVNQKNELRYTLAIRSSYLLNKDLSDILKLAYDTRSEIVHNGDISKSTLNKIKKLLTIKEDIDIDIDFGILFNFLNEYLEPITRKILNVILLKLYENPELNINQITKNLDRNIAKSFEK